MYEVRFSGSIPELKGRWNGSIWDMAEKAVLTNFRHEGSDHRPLTEVKLLYSLKGISGIFSVHDRYIRCIHTGYMAHVYKDSCVEFFVRPFRDKGYFNFEFNCGGNVICSYITDPTRVSGGFRKAEPLSFEDIKRISVFHSLPEVITEEITEPVRWFLEFFIPFDIFEKYTGVPFTVPSSDTADIPGITGIYHPEYINDKTDATHMAYLQKNLAGKGSDISEPAGVTEMAYPRKNNNSPEISGIYERTVTKESMSGRIWTANFQKCADETSHPHWVSWMPLPELNFHLPDFFGEIVFRD